MIYPISDFKTRRLNATLHGRSVYRSEDVPSHNVFKGYSSPGTGDAIDLFCPANTAVFAIDKGKITRWQNDTTKLEVVYVEGDNWCAVYAHINFNEQHRIGDTVNNGDVIGFVRGDLKDPHLHFELWVGGRSVRGSTPEICRDVMTGYMSSPTELGVPIIKVSKDSNGNEVYTRIAVGSIPKDGPNKDKVVGPISDVVKSLGHYAEYKGDRKLYVY